MIYSTPHVDCFTTKKAEVPIPSLDSRGTYTPSGKALNDEGTKIHELLEKARGVSTEIIRE